MHTSIQEHPNPKKTDNKIMRKKGFMPTVTVVTILIYDLSIGRHIKDATKS